MPKIDADALKAHYMKQRAAQFQRFTDPELASVMHEAMGWDEVDEAADKALRAHIKATWEAGNTYDNPWPARSFLQVREEIESTSLFAFLKAMPKGAILHMHPSSMGDFAGLLEQAAAHEEEGKRFWVSSKMRKEEADKLFLLAAEGPEGYRSLAEAWAQPESRAEVLGTLALTPEDADYPGDKWDLFTPIFGRVDALLCVQPLVEGYYGRALAYLVEDNLQHLELRTSWHPENEAKAGTKEHSILKGLAAASGLSLKVVYSDVRITGKRPSSILADIVRVGRHMMEQQDPRVVGYDLVAEEDTGRQTIFFLDEIFEAAEQLDGHLPPFFFHDGESPLPPDYRMGDPEVDGVPAKLGFNNNMVDAYLLNTLSIMASRRRWRGWGTASPSSRPRSSPASTERPAWRWSSARSATRSSATSRICAPTRGRSTWRRASR